MRNSRTAVFLIAGFFLLLIISAGCISQSPKNSSEPSDLHSALLNGSATRNPALISTSSGLKQFPPEIQVEIRTLSDNYSIAPDYWGFDSLNNEIDLIAYGIHDLNATKDLQKKKIGNYSIHIFNDTEWQSTAKEVADHIWELGKYPDNKIGGSELVNDPKGPYAILWCYSSTPANKKLDNTMIKGWKIFVYMQSFPPPMQTTITMSSYVTS